MAEAPSSSISIEVGQIWDAPSWPAAGSRIVVLERLSGHRWLVWSELGNRIVESGELLARYAPVGVSLRPAELAHLPTAPLPQRPPPARGGLDSSP
jgi:hypothetical protein